MFKEIPIILFIEKIYNIITQILMEWFDVLFPYLIIDDYSNLFFVLEKNSYDMSIFGYGYLYNHRIDTEEDIKSSRFIPYGLFIMRIGNHYYMTRRVSEQNDKKYIFRCINPLVRDFRILVRQLNKIKKAAQIRQLLAMDVGGQTLFVSSIGKPAKFIKQALLDQIKKLYKYELSSKCQNHNISILMHGPPGTGKSTNIAALSYFMEMNVLTINIENMSNNNIINLASQKNMIILFEDWFPAFIEEYFINKEKYKNDNRNFSLFLNLLSGLASVKNCILIFTCNSVNEIFNESRIYPLFRPGRINHIFEIRHDKFYYKQPTMKNNKLSFE